MMEDVGMSESLAGILAAFNYAGYLVGALIISFIKQLDIKVKLYKIGLVSAVVTTVLMAATTNQYIWYLLRFVSGLSSSAGVLLGGGLLVQYLMQNESNTQLGVFFSCFGLGIAVTALVAEFIKRDYFWSQQWIIFGVIGFFLILPALFGLPKVHQVSQNNTSGNTLTGSLPNAFFVVLQLGYFCAGFGYVVTATYIVAIVDTIPAYNHIIWVVWLLVGLAAAPGCWVWDKYKEKIGIWPAMTQAYIANMLSNFLLLMEGNIALIPLSALLFGFSFMGIVSMTLSLVGQLFPDNPTKPMARLTFGYGIAQVIAPVIVGVMADQNGNYFYGLCITVVVIACGVGFVIRAAQLYTRNIKYVQSS